MYHTTLRGLLGSLFASGLAAVLTGCATLPEPMREVYDIAPPKPQWNATTCEQTDWYQFGLEQGEKRHIDVDMSEIATLCVEQGVNININEYLRGLESHAKSYCTPQQGRQLGLEGQPYPNLCRQEVYSEFYFEWYRGAQDYCHNQAANLQPTSAVCQDIKS